MEEQQRARSHTVTTTTSSFAENFSTTSSSFAYDREFLRTPPGLLIVAEIVSVGPGRARPGRAEGGRWTRLARAPPAPPTELAPVSRGLRNAPELSFDFFVKRKTHIQVLSPEVPLGTGVVTLRMCFVGGISQLVAFIRRMVAFPESRILWWAFIDHGRPEYLGPTSPDLPRMDP